MNEQKAEDRQGEKPYLTVEEIAEELGVSEDWVRKLIRSGKLDADYVGGYAVLREAFEAYRAQRRPPGRPPKRDSAEDRGVKDETEAEDESDVLE
ncbi:MAG: helix-turn-helix domain-containing protein [Anaerolineae bacterium]|nr:helix-turn-helix domain-containing protein [Anaerolineae bacterium]